MPISYNGGWNTGFRDNDSRILRIANSEQPILVSVIQAIDRYNGSNVEFRVSTVASGNVVGGLDTIHVHFAGPATAADKTQWNSKVKIIKFKGATPTADVNLYDQSKGGKLGNLNALAVECRNIGFHHMRQALDKLGSAWNTHRGM